MTERGSISVQSSMDKRCSQCVFGKKIVANISGGNISEGKVENKWELNTLPVGQTRNCFNWFQRTFKDPPIFIYPGSYDICINPKQFIQK